MIETHGALLAGGGSRRFGAPKGLADLAGRPLVRWVANTLCGVATTAVLVGPDGEVARASGLPAIPDLRPGLGPIGGLHAGLSWLADQGGSGLLVVPCDTPLVSRELLELVRGGGESTRVVELDGRVHPLCGFYRLDVLEELERRLARRALDLTGLVADLGLHTVSVADHLGHEQARRELANINTPEELSAIQENVT